MSLYPLKINFYARKWSHHDQVCRPERLFRFCQNTETAPVLRTILTGKVADQETLQLCTTLLFKQMTALCVQ